MCPFINALLRAHALARINIYTLELHIYNHLYSMNVHKKICSQRYEIGCDCSGTTFYANHMFEYSWSCKHEWYNSEKMQHCRAVDLKQLFRFVFYSSKFHIFVNRWFLQHVIFSRHHISSCSQEHEYREINTVHLKIWLEFLKFSEKPLQWLIHALKE